MLPGPLLSTCGEPGRADQPPCIVDSIVSTAVALSFCLGRTSTLGLRLRLPRPMLRVQ